MWFLRKSALVILTPIFITLLFVTAFDTGVVRTLGSANNVKNIVNQSGVYTSLVPAVLKQVGSANSNNGSGSVDLSNAQVQQAAEAAFTPQLIQTDTNQAIDSIYAWLNGQTATPDFNIDLSGPKAVFADKLATAAQTEVASLPACPAAFSGNQNFDPFNASCLPPGVTPAQAGQQAKDAILNGNFLDQPITANQLKSGNSNQSVFANQLKSVPKQYQRVKKTPIILAALTVLVAAALVFLRASKRKGLRHVGLIVGIMGLLMLAFSYGLHRVVAQNLAPNIKLDNLVLQDRLRTLATDLTAAVDKNYWTFGAVYTVLGIAAVATPMIINKRRSGGTAPATAATTMADTPEPTTPAIKPKPEPRKINIIQ